MMKSARLRFSASGVCRARIVSNSFADMPRASTRARLHIGRRRHHRHGVGALVAAGFEQQRNVEHDDIGALGFGLFEKRLLHAADDRVNNRFQFLHRLRLAQHLAAQGVAIDASVLAHHAGKGPFQRGRRLAARAISGVHRRIRIIDRQAARREHRCGRGLSHADRSGQRKLDHRRTATTARQAASAPSASGDTPNQRRKAASAWPTSILNPSCVFQPASPAAASVPAAAFP